MFAPVRARWDSTPAYPAVCSFDNTVYGVSFIPEFSHSCQVISCGLRDVISFLSQLRNPAPATAPNALCNNGPKLPFIASSWTSVFQTLNVPIGARDNAKNGAQACAVFPRVSQCGSVCPVYVPQRVRTRFAAT